MTSVICERPLTHHCCCGQGSRSTHAPFLATLPAATLSPLLWSEEQLSLITGSPVKAEARTRRAALEKEWAGVAESVAADPSLYPPGGERSLVTGECMCRPVHCWRRAGQVLPGVTRATLAFCVMSFSECSVCRDCA